MSKIFIDIEDLHPKVAGDLTTSRLAELDSITLPIHSSFYLLLPLRVPGHNTGGKPDKITGTCHYCGKEGHWQSKCRKKAREEGRPETAGRRTNSGQRNARGTDGDQASSNAVFMFSAIEVAPIMVDDEVNDYLQADLTWDWDVRPIRQVSLHGEVLTVTFHLEIVCLRRFIDDNDPTSVPSPRSVRPSQ
ncbi:hypothetical protein H310_05677 [Aphanomyces invadans]|uniref:CCHC-type domain-containing protein n=1 Tax=Aphanomyces invadans TaxID=157072 RepID=A0A024U768_9STRA|nr:hypothetical protein H310_05677 [Aphanomyces invadans]ETW02065.1 hypothetical protein H310_05677 [Aphanomyces invadans]|eukprot:XP_008868670.1 hypothetical protein H310_05677 [Aphanomyces invadans]